MIKLFSYLFLLSVVYSLSYRATNALFSYSAISAENTFAASAVFPSISPSPSPTPSVANHIVISEVQITGGSGEANNDFVELYNPTNNSIDLNGHRLVKRTGNSSTDDTIKSWTTSAIVPAHGFYLWANSGDSFAVNIQADTSTTETLSSSSSIALRSGAVNTGTIIDAVSWNEGSTLGEGTVFTPNPAGDQSVERKANGSSDATSMTSGADIIKGNGFDSDNNAADFILRTASQPQNSTSPTETP